MSPLVGEWIRRNVPAWMPAPRGAFHPFWSFRVLHNAHGRHPFVPARLSPVAHCTVHRPQCPIITGSGSDFR